MHLEKYIEQSTPASPNIQGFTTAIIDERIKNVFPMDVFSRLMMDRIIFLGVPVNDYDERLKSFRFSVSGSGFSWYLTKY